MKLSQTIVDACQLLMATAKRNISEVAGSSDSPQLTRMAANDAFSVTEMKPDLKTLARAVEIPNKSAATPSEDALDDDDFDESFGNNDDGLNDDRGADENATVTKPGVDLDAVPSHIGKPLTEFNVNSEFKDGKPWLKPGADISDWFNYGFNEITWQRYLEKQRALRSHFALRPVEPQRLQAIGTTPSGGNNFLNEIGGMFPRFNRGMMPTQQPPPFMMQMIQQQQQQMQRQQIMQMPQQQQQQGGLPQQQLNSFPNFRPNIGPPVQPSMQGPRLQPQQQAPVDMQNLPQQHPPFQQQVQSIMVRSQQPLNTSNIQVPQMQRAPFNFSAGRMLNVFRHPSQFPNNPNSMVPGQQARTGVVPMRPNIDQQPPPPSGLQSNQPTGPPSVSGPRRQLTSLTG